MKVFISTTTFSENSKDPLCLLEKRNIKFDVNSEKRRLSEKEILEVLSKGSYIGLIAGTEPLTRQVLENAKSLKIISRVGVGLDNIDLEAVKNLDINIYNTPDVLTDAVSELTIGLIISCLRKMPQLDRNMRNSVFRKEMGALFRGKTLGIIGFGRIGARVADIAAAFECRVVFFDIQTIETRKGRQVSFDELIEISDIISIHISKGSELISQKEINKMKDGVILINTSRGAAINEADLYQGLVSEKILSAALDVFSKEPYTGKLTTLDNVVLTPHIGSYAKEARIKMEIEAVNNLLKGLDEINGR
jgi:D-3-phosphoglycerate dehydrogenase